MQPITEINGRPVHYANIYAHAVGMITSCNCCDRVIFADEYIDSPAGYCPECLQEAEAEQDQNQLTIF